MPLTATIRPSSRRSSARRRARRRPRRAAGPSGRERRCADRTPGTHSAGRGSAGPPGRRTRPGTPRTSRTRHRRGGPVVGYFEHDRVARPAVRAVRERVAVAAVPRVVHFGQAVGAGGAVDAHRRVRARGRRCSRRCGRCRRRRHGGSSPSRPRSPGPAAAAPRSAAGSSSATSAVSPSTSMSTPAESFSTNPASPSATAWRNTKGRKPTPCTVPVTLTRRRSAS